MGAQRQMKIELARDSFAAAPTAAASPAPPEASLLRPDMSQIADIVTAALPSGLIYRAAALAGAGGAALLRGEALRAYHQADRALRAIPTDVHTQFVRAEALCQLGRVEESLAQGSCLLRQAPAHETGAWRHALRLCGAGAAGEAVDLLRSLAIAHPQALGPTTALVLSLIANGDRPEACRVVAGACKALRAANPQAALWLESLASRPSGSGHLSQHTARKRVGTGAPNLAALSGGTLATLGAGAPGMRVSSELLDSSVWHRMLHLADQQTCPRTEARLGFVHWRRGGDDEAYRIWSRLALVQPGLLLAQMGLAALEAQSHQGPSAHARLLWVHAVSNSAPRQGCPEGWLARVEWARASLVVGHQLAEARDTLKRFHRTGVATGLKALVAAWVADTI